MNIAAAIVPEQFVLPAPFAPNADLDIVRTGVVSQLPVADAAAQQYVAAHGAKSPGAFQKFAASQLTGPPSAQVQAQELALEHRLQDGRTAAGVETATWYDRSGDGGLWTGFLQQWQATVSGAQAQQGAALLHQAWQLADGVCHDVKHTFDRTRPYAVDSTLKPIVVASMNPHGSYPSQHVTNAFAAAAILTHLMPARAAEFEQAAEQVAFARVYSAVHFPSDAAAGALLGRLAADYVLAGAHA